MMDFGELKPQRPQRFQPAVEESRRVGRAEQTMKSFPCRRDWKGARAKGSAPEGSRVFMIYGVLRFRSAVDDSSPIIGLPCDQLDQLAASSSGG
jgi:hypothetical protein